MDIVISVGSLVGQRLPENFNHPFAAKNFLDFWSRWHMTLSNWFKFYLFNPLLILLKQRLPGKKAEPYLGVFAFFVTFLVMGIWHGPTMVFVIYGLVMGLGVSVNKIWQIVLSKRLGKPRYRALSENVWYGYICRGLTTSYFCISLTGLWIDMQQLTVLADKVGGGGLVVSYGLLAMVAAVFWIGWDQARKLLSAVTAVVPVRSSGVMIRNLGLAAQILLILALSSLITAPTEFIYRAF